MSHRPRTATYLGALSLVTNSGRASPAQLRNRIPRLARQLGTYLCDKAGTTRSNTGQPTLLLVCCVPVAARDPSPVLLSGRRPHGCPRARRKLNSSWRLPFIATHQRGCSSPRFSTTPLAQRADRIAHHTPHHISPQPASHHSHIQGSA